MDDYSPRTQQRHQNGPQPVAQAREMNYAYDRQSREHDERSHRRSKKAPSSEKKSKRRSETSTRHRSTKHVPSLRSKELPIWRLDVLSQPTSNIVLGVDVGIAALLSLQYPEPELVPEMSCDASNLFAVVSLVTESRYGERKPLEAGSIIGKSLADSPRQAPDHFEASYRRSHPCRLVIGFFALQDLVIRQAGAYRIRLTVLQGPAIGSCNTGPAIIAEVDSDLIKVDRRPANFRSRLA